jgi:hypothetical protein
MLNSGSSSSVAHSVLDAMRIYLSEGKVGGLSLGGGF